MNRWSCFASVVIGLAVGLGSGVFAEEQAQHVELLLKVHKNGQVTVLQQTLRAGELPGPKYPEFREGFWALQAQDNAGQDVYATAIPDPRLLVAHWANPEKAGRLAGQTVLLEEAVFPVRLPKDARITHLKVSRLKRAIDRPHRDPRQPAAAAGAPAGPRLPEDAVEHLDSLPLEIQP